ncbi:MAG: hypothetical protein IJ237_06790, partial [Oscillospiraceae bacterium]|nr:hypothetical protein [Oscillospiraceae bacterium]
QRRKIVDDRLHNIAHKAGNDGFVIILFHRSLTDKSCRYDNTATEKMQGRKRLTKEKAAPYNE